MVEDTKEKVEVEAKQTEEATKEETTKVKEAPTENTPEVSETPVSKNDSKSDSKDESDDDDDSDDDSKSNSEQLTEPSITEDVFVELRKEVRDLGKKKELLFETRSLVSQQIKELFQTLKDKKEQRDELTSKVKKLKKERESINSDIKESIGKIKSVGGAPAERIPIGKIKKELENLQYKVETTPLSPDEEKKVMRLIREKQKEIAKADTSTALKGEAKELSKEINDSKKESNDIHTQIQDAAKESQDNHEEMIAVSKDIKYLKAREKEIHYSFSEIKDVYKEKRRLYTQNKKFYEKSKPKRKDNRVNEAQVMEKVEANVEEKMKKGMKITTEDLMSFGR